MATWRHKTHPAITNPDSNPWGGLVATFDDGSTITVIYRGGEHDPDVDSAPRQRYAYTINQRDFPRTVEANEIRSGCGDPISYTRALAALCSFLGADAEHYAGHHNAGCCGRSLTYLHWADGHEDEIWSLQDELDLINSADSHQPPI